MRCSGHLPNGGMDCRSGILNGRASAATGKWKIQRLRKRGGKIRNLKPPEKDPGLRNSVCFSRKIESVHKKQSSTAELNALATVEWTRASHFTLIGSLNVDAEGIGYKIPVTELRFVIEESG